jgi:hypothetical protein
LFTRLELFVQHKCLRKHHIVININNNNRQANHAALTLVGDSSSGMGLTLSSARTFRHSRQMGASNLGRLWGHDYDRASAPIGGDANSSALKLPEIELMSGIALKSKLI